MISEWRRLTFTMDELATAILQYLLQTNKITEKESLGKILIVGDDSLQVNATVKGGDKPEGRIIELKSETLGALLLTHCIRSKIPVAKRAKKSIMKHEDKLALILSID
ncbi:hypothetical protein [Dongia rigui]|uniref:Uncharacterized protein n=1 Tax=Dongia rigui TaxID=940149 RepID=A0ABU5E037_9PROT|nr:hypothetical protein [Dongia rigui]MDY0872921.1 hypothetical protein [Dongia rigui]